MPPATQPRTPAPAQISSGKRSSNLSKTPVPNITSGADSASPNTMRRIDPCAAAAMASTLSSDITASATMIDITAPQRLGLASTSLRSWSPCGNLIAT